MTCIQCLGRRSWISLLLLALLNVLLIVVYFRWTTILSGRAWPNPLDRHPNSSASKPDSSTCPDVKINAAVIVKTGATVAQERLTVMLRTSLRCVQDPLLFSDLPQIIDHHQVHDVLASFSPSAMVDNEDFDLYRKQQELVRQGREEELSSLRTNDPNYGKSKETSGWRLDKYKFLHAVEQAWKLSPARDWYIFVEADTYLNWKNVNHWLETLDPREQHYFGMPIHMPDYKFAHGGAGIVLSGAAVKAFAVDHKGIASRWDDRIRTMSFGDAILAKALAEELNLNVSDAFPSMRADQPFIISWGQREWCRPLITLHHIDEEMQEKLQELESLESTNLVRFRGLYYHQNINKLEYARSSLSDWDNLSGVLAEALEPNNHTSASLGVDACSDACRSIESCLQYSYSVEERPNAPPERRCMLSRVFRYGRQFGPEKTDEGVRSWYSGWMSERIATFVSQQPSCEEVAITWPH